MIIYFADRGYNILGMGSTSLPGAYIITNDTHLEDLETGVTTLEFNVRYFKDQQVEIKQLCKEGNYILYKGKKTDTCFTIIETENDPIECSMYVYAEDLGLDLINEFAGPFTSLYDYPITYYLEKWLSDDFEIGINEISNLRRRLNWDGEATAKERIRSVATQFDNAEIGYRFEIYGLQLVGKYVDIYKSYGKDVEQELRIGREIDNIVEKRSVANLATALYCTGDAPEVDGEMGDPITLDGYRYDDGDFYVDGPYLKSRNAVEAWGRYNAKRGVNDDHTIRAFSYETTSQTELCTRAISELMKIREPYVTYDVSLLYLPENLEVGDTVRLVDDLGQLYLSARLLSLSISEANETISATFGDFVVKSSGISEKVEELARKFAELAATRQLYTWMVYADDDQGTNMSLSSVGKAYIGIATNKIHETPDLTDPTLYKWSKILGEDGVDGTDSLSFTIESSTGTIFKDRNTTETFTLHIYRADQEITNLSDIGDGVYVRWYVNGTYQSGTSGRILTYYLGNAGSKAIVSALLVQDIGD